MTDAAYVQALEESRRLSRDEGIDAALGEHRLDALAAPTTGPAGLIDAVNGDFVGGGASTPAAMAGYPMVTVPAGWAQDALPLGLTFIGRAYSEPVLLRLAYAFEVRARAFRRPAFRPALLPD